MTTGFYGGKFLPFHKGHLFMAIRASELVDKLYVVVSNMPERYLNLCKEAGQENITTQQRVTWISHELKDYSNIVVCSRTDLEEDNGFTRYEFEEEIDYVFSSEPDYTEIFATLYPTARHVILDTERKFVNCWGNHILKDPFKYWQYLTPIVRKHFNKKILITGIESTGKTTMCKKLAQYYNTVWAQEIGREYATKFNNALLPEHFNEIAIAHMSNYDKMLESANKYLFIDSDAVVTKYYMRKYLDSGSYLLEKLINTQWFDQHFYLDGSTKWVDDGQRFLSNNRKDEDEELFNMYQGHCMELCLISGNSYHSRMEQIISQLEASNYK